MHEYSIAEELIRQILEIAEDNNLKKIDSVDLEVGELKQIVPAAMRECFKSVGAGTIAQNAVLKIKDIKAKAVCRRCKAVFKPCLNYFVCRHCGLADVDIIKGDDIIIKSIKGEKDKM